MSNNPDRPPIDELARKLAASLPAGLRAVRDDLEQNFRSVLRSGIGKLDLVTREEFEVQQRVLARTREKLEAMAARLETMEKETEKKPVKTGPAKKKSRRAKKTGGDDGKPAG